jgi:very-short-patch-repair endonuclease
LNSPLLQKEGWLSVSEDGVVDYLILFLMNSDNHLFNRKSLGKYRTTLRKNLTSAEASLWNLLKHRQVSRHKFRRQHSIGNYIVDFCCPQEMLIIELDGNIHGEYDQIVKDEIRDNYLKKLGFTVLRFENKHVFQDPELVINEIRKCFPEKQ